MLLLLVVVTVVMIMLFLCFVFVCCLCFIGSFLYFAATSAYMVLGGRMLQGALEIN